MHERARKSEQELRVKMESERASERVSEGGRRRWEGSKRVGSAIEGYAYIYIYIHMYVYLCD